MAGFNLITEACIDMMSQRHMEFLQKSYAPHNTGGMLAPAHDLQSDVIAAIFLTNIIPTSHFEQEIIR